jgi:hypothetical protein
VVTRRAIEPVRDWDDTKTVTWRVREPGGRLIGVIVNRSAPASTMRSFAALASDGRELGEFASKANAADTIALDWKDMQVEEFAHRRAADRRREQYALAAVPPLTLPRGTT